MKIMILYATTTGNTAYVAEVLKSFFPNDEVVVKNVEENVETTFSDYELFILGTPTWGEGEMHKSWKRFFETCESQSLRGKKVAIFGLGDSLMFPDRFVDGMRELYECVLKVGANIIGKSSTEGYNFLHSKAIIEGEFCGLALDQDNESSKTIDRLSEWVKRINKEFG